MEDGKGRAANKRSQALMDDAWWRIAGNKLLQVAASFAPLSGSREREEVGMCNGKTVSDTAVLTSATTKTASIVGSNCKWGHAEMRETQQSGHL